jgi:hypothetical protein
MATAFWDRSPAMSTFDPTPTCSRKSVGTVTGIECPNVMLPVPEFELPAFVPIQMLLLPVIPVDAPIAMVLLELVPAPAPPVGSSHTHPDKPMLPGPTFFPMNTELDVFVTPAAVLMPTATTLDVLDISPPVP